MALLTGVRDIMVASGQSVNHIDAMIQNAQGPAVGIGQDDIGNLCICFYNIIYLLLFEL